MLTNLDLDESKIFLLQTAFRSLGNFFSLARNPQVTTSKSFFHQLQQQRLQLRSKTAMKTLFGGGSTDDDFNLNSLSEGDQKQKHKTANVSSPLVTKKGSNGAY